MSFFCVCRYGFVFVWLFVSLVAISLSFVHLFVFFCCVRARLPLCLCFCVAVVISTRFIMCVCFAVGGLLVFRCACVFVVCSCLFPVCDLGWFELCLCCGCLFVCAFAFFVVCFVLILFVVSLHVLFFRFSVLVSFAFCLTVCLFFSLFVFGCLPVCLFARVFVRRFPFVSVSPFVCPCVCLLRCRVFLVDGRYVSLPPIIICAVV